MWHVGVVDEPRVERLDAAKAGGSEVHGVLGHTSKTSAPHRKYRRIRPASGGARYDATHGGNHYLPKPPHNSPFIIIRPGFTVSDAKN